MSCKILEGSDSYYFPSGSDSPVSVLVSSAKPPTASITSHALCEAVQHAVFILVFLFPHLLPLHSLESAALELNLALHTPWESVSEESLVG